MRVRWKGAPVKIMTSSSATKLNTQFTMAKQHFSSGKIYLGIYTFLSSGAALSTLLMLVEVASLKKLKSSWPHIRKTGKLSMPLPRISIRLLNTAQANSFHDQLNGHQKGHTGQRTGCLLYTSWGYTLF